MHKFSQKFKINNPEIFLILLIGVCSLIYYIEVDQLNVDYNYQYYFYDYHFGFTKRALIGELFNHIPVKMSETLMINISMLMIIFISLLVFFIIDRIKITNKIYLYLLMVFIFVNPALLKNIWFDIGRLDNYGILYCALLLFVRNKNLKNILFLISPVVLLIHEAFLVMWLPTYAICWFISNDMKINKLNIFYFTIFSIITLSASFIINKFGMLNENYAVFQEYIYSKAGKQIRIETEALVDEAMYKLVFESGISNFKHTKFWIVSITVTFVMISTIKCYLKDLLINYNKYKIYIIIPVLCAVLMVFLGLDVLRWFSNMSFSLFFILLAILQQNNKQISKIGINDISNKKIVFIIFISVLMINIEKIGVWY